MPTPTTSNKPPTPSANPNAGRPAHKDPQPSAPHIKPGKTDQPANHLHAGAHHKPTTQQIQERAYQIWQRRGGGDGNAAIDWLQAERELLTEINARNAD